MFNPDPTPTLLPQNLKWGSFKANDRILPTLIFSNTLKLKFTGLTESTAYNWTIKVQKGLPNISAIDLGNFTTGAGETTYDLNVYLTAGLYNVGNTYYFGLAQAVQGGDEGIQFDFNIDNRITLDTNGGVISGQLINQAFSYSGEAFDVLTNKFLDEESLELDNITVFDNLRIPTNLAVQTYVASAIAGKENTITAGTTLQYYRGDKTFQTLDTSVVPEDTNLYFTGARVRSTPLTGFSANNNTITATDTVLEAFEKAQGQIDTKQATLVDNDITTDLIDDNAVNNTKLAQMPENTLKGNNTGDTANASDLTAEQTRGLLEVETIAENRLFISSNIQPLSVSNLVSSYLTRTLQDSFVVEDWRKSRMIKETNDILSITRQLPLFWIDGGLSVNNNIGTTTKTYNLGTLDPSIFGTMLNGDASTMVLNDNFVFDTANNNQILFDGSLWDSSLSDYSVYVEYKANISAVSNFGILGQENSANGRFFLTQESSIANGRLQLRVENGNALSGASDLREQNIKATITKNGNNYIARIKINEGQNQEYFNGVRNVAPLEGAFGIRVGRGPFADAAFDGTIKRIMIFENGLSQTQTDNLHNVLN